MAKAKPKVTTIDSGWSLVESGSWQVSVSPDGLIMLPRHLSPEEVQDFADAVLAAAEVGAEVQRTNEELGKNDEVILPDGSALVTEGGTPPGAVRMITNPGPNVPYSTIGRRG